jgi:ubiquinone/menaquinone biosynthesis C-methylase UbiE
MPEMSGRTPSPRGSRELSPVQRSHTQAQDWYDRLSGIYRTWIGQWESGLRRQALQALQVRTGERVLEVGCGPGQDLPALIDAAGTDGRVVGMDLSRGMLEQARKAVPRGGTIHLVQGNGVSLPFASQVFDGVYMSFVLELFDTLEMEQVLGEGSRVLQPGGRLVLLSLAKSDKPGLLERLYEAAHARFPVQVDCRPIYARQAAEQTGFRVEEEMRLKMWGLATTIVVCRKSVYSNI